MVKSKADDEKVVKQPTSYNPWQWYIIGLYRNVWRQTMSGTVRRMMEEWYTMHDLLYQWRIEGETGPDTLRRILIQQKEKTECTDTVQE